MPADERFLKGLELFNKNEFYECHEVIESLWLETPCGDPHRDLFKGVIQAAAAVYQFERGILSGALGLYRSSVQYLDKYTPWALGLNVAKLIQEIKICFKSLNEWDGKTKLELKGSLIPKLEFKNAT